jgi:hypothetical protein
VSKPTLEQLQVARDVINYLWTDDKLSVHSWNETLSAVEITIDKGITDREAQTARRTLADRDPDLTLGGTGFTDASGKFHPWITDETAADNPTVDGGWC